MMLEIVLFGMDAPPLVWWRVIPAPVLMLPRGWFDHHVSSTDY